VDMLESNVDAFVQRFDRMGTPNPESSSYIMYEVTALCEIFGIQWHSGTECQAYF